LDVARDIEGRISFPHSGVVGNAVGTAERDQEAKDPRPVGKRYTAGRSTYQRLLAYIRENPTGLLLLYDEASQLLRALDPDKNPDLRSLIVSGWNGDGTHEYGSNNLGDNDLENVCLSLYGAIQNDVLQAVVLMASKDGGQRDGLLERFQFAVCPDDDIDWAPNDVSLSAEVVHRVTGIFRAIDNIRNHLKPEHWVQGDRLPSIGFTSDAEVRWNDWLKDLRNIRRRKEGGFMASHIAKYPKLVAALALIVEILKSARLDTPASNPSYPWGGGFPAWRLDLPAAISKVSLDTAIEVEA
jgi:Protein of unknown function (DUF3987)